MKDEKDMTTRQKECMARILPMRDEMERLYVNGDLSQRDCAKIFGCSQTMFGRWLKMLDLPIKSCGRKGELHSQYIDGSEMRPYLKLIVKRECAKCKTTESLAVHHKDGDHYNNELGNLMILCRSCHTTHHMKLR